MSDETTTDEREWEPTPEQLSLKVGDEVEWRCAGETRRCRVDSPIRLVADRYWLIGVNGFSCSLVSLRSVTPVAASDEHDDRLDPDEIDDDSDPADDEPDEQEILRGVKDRLIAGGFDGLYLADESGASDGCACVLANLAACGHVEPDADGGWINGCRPGYRRAKDGCDCCVGDEPDEPIGKPYGSIASEAAAMNFLVRYLAGDDAPPARNPSTGFPDFADAPTYTAGINGGWEDLDHGD